MKKAAIFLSALVLLIGVSSACEYVSAWDERIPTSVSPPQIPLWIPQHFDDLCGYFVQDGYFSTIFELDAFYRWKYPEIYDTRILDLVYYGENCNPHSGNAVGCKINYTFMEWYWDDTDTVRAWLRELWDYPDDWRLIIAVSEKLYYEGGETVEAMDRDVALTPELINNANKQYSPISTSASASLDPIAKPTSSINLQLAAGILPSFYNNLALKYEELFGYIGGAPHSSSIINSVIQLINNFIEFILSIFSGIGW